MLESKKIYTAITELRGDLHTAVGLYACLRNSYSSSLLLESTDFTADSNCFSYICVDPIAGFKAKDNSISTYFEDNKINSDCENDLILSKFIDFKSSFSNESPEYPKGVVNGFFGYISYESIQYFEDIKLSQKSDENRDIPDLNYELFRFVIVINHFKHQMYLIENSFSNDFSKSEPLRKSLLAKINNPSFNFGHFDYSENEDSNFTDEEYLDLVETCKKHIKIGDIFQIVPSRKFITKYSGDDFNLYRALRSINPSPYLFYFNYGDFRIIGSSPEAELITTNNKAEIYPIAGTSPRSGDSKIDEDNVEKLLANAKENAEHVMLVDLARNDLSKHCTNVNVDSFREVHFFSHVIHLVSKVSGVMKKNINSINLLADTFPAGTLSGAPKYRAMELIDKYERGKRGHYGGALGFIGFNNDSHHAIIIRSFLSKNGYLYRQAGGGIVIDSEAVSELNEVNSKLKALKLALSKAKVIGGDS
ncbi:UNVERIFIED_CONTAM: hypothetical protein GTU68_048669 [Idotea baltica]|nr:hypothetical protein [Idotea baltica]